MGPHNVRLSISYIYTATDPRINEGCGAVTGVRRAKNPIRACRLVMEQSPHVFLSGSAVDTLAEQHDLDLCEPEYFVTPHRVQQLHQTLEEQAIVLDHDDGKTEKNQKMGTVGAVARDQQGLLAGV